MGRSRVRPSARVICFWLTRFLTHSQPISLFTNIPTSLVLLAIQFFAFVETCSIVPIITMSSTHPSSSNIVKRERNFHSKARNIHVLASPARRTLAESLVPISASAPLAREFEAPSSDVEDLEESIGEGSSEPRDEEAGIPRRVYHERTVKGWETRRKHETELRERLGSGPLSRPFLPCCGFPTQARLS